MWFLFTNTGTQKTANNIYHYLKKRVAPQNLMCNNDVTYLTKWKKFTCINKENLSFTLRKILEKGSSKQEKNQKNTSKKGKCREEKSSDQSEVIYSVYNNPFIRKLL